MVMDRYTEDTSMRFENTGQERRPRKGEWYMGVLRLPVLADRDFSIRCLPILRRVDDRPRTEDETERDRIDTQERQEHLGAAPRPALAPPPQPRPGPVSGGFRSIKADARKFEREHRLPYPEDV